MRIRFTLLTALFVNIPRNPLNIRCYTCVEYLFSLIAAFSTLLDRIECCETGTGQAKFKVNVASLQKSQCF